MKQKEDLTCHVRMRLHIARKLLLLSFGAFAVVLTIGIFNSPASNAQTTPDAQPRFEVASIKRHQREPGSRFAIGSSPIVTIENGTLELMIQIAYGVRQFQISGGPEWIYTDGYDIQAKADGAFTPGQLSMLVQRRRLQTLLQDRFKLELHRETKELPIYELRVAKGGFKLQPLKDGSCLQSDPTHPGPAPGHQMSEYCGYGGFGSHRFEVTSTTMTDLAESFSRAVGRKVVDKTGITGTYQVRLTYVPDQMTSPAGDAANAGPSIYTAVQEQLGLKLESAKGLVDVLIIDYVERPSEN